MRAGLIGLGMIAALAGLGGPGCSTTTKACTEIGCSNGFSASIQRADGSFPGGMHRIEILADGVTQMCAFTVPSELPPGGVTPTCATGVGVTVGPELRCTEMQSGGAVSLRCDPIPGRFIETIAIAGTPGQVHVWQYVDGVAILDAAAAPSYADTRPNGPECEPVCRQASASWTLQ